MATFFFMNLSFCYVLHSSLRLQVETVQYFNILVVELSVDYQMNNLFLVTGRPKMWIYSNNEIFG